MNAYKWTCDRIFIGGKASPDLVFINGNPVAYFKQVGESQKPTVYVKQGMNRDEFKVNLLANLPEFCEANDINDKTIFDICTEYELDFKASICRVNNKSQVATNK